MMIIVVVKGTGNVGMVEGAVDCYGTVLMGAFRFGGTSG